MLIIKTTNYTTTVKHNGFVIEFYHRDAVNDPISSRVVFEDLINQANRSMVTKFNHSDIFGSIILNDYDQILKSVEKWFNTLSSIDYYLMLKEVYRPDSQK